MSPRLLDRHLTGSYFVYFVAPRIGQGVNRVIEPFWHTNRIQARILRRAEGRVLRFCGVKFGIGNCLHVISTANILRLGLGHIAAVPDVHLERHTLNYVTV